MPPSIAESVGGGIILASALYYFYETREKQQDNLPPTAPGYLPVIGHLLQLIKPAPIHELFTKWSQEAGPIYTCYFGSQRWIVLNSSDTIKDLIVDRGTIYSSRKLPDTLVHDFLQGDEGGGFAFFPYGASWRRLRRIAHGGLTKNRIDTYQPILDTRRTMLLSNLYNVSQDNINQQSGIDLSCLFEHYTMSSILTIAFGDMCSFEPGNPVLHEAFKLTDRAAKALSPSDQLREFFPIIQKLWPVKREKYFKVREDVITFYGGLLQQFKAKIEEDHTKVQDCFVKEILELGELTDLQIMHFISIFVGAGSETTTSTLRWLVAYLANHPEIQDKAFEEIKHSVGLERLPGAQDESKLPYVQCIIHETLRIRPPAPSAIPHSTSKDDVYRDWVIPEGTIIALNLHAVHNDPNRFENPTEFIPERHMNYIIDAQNKRIFSQSVEDRPHLSFSTGRRVCVGIYLAERSLYMAASMLLASFKFERICDDLIDVDTPKDVRATTWSPIPFNVRLVPRHDRVNTFL